MVTRQERLDGFAHDGDPPVDQPLELLCEDHVGTYVVPFLCRWTTTDWHNVETGQRIEATVIGWRPKRQPAG
jgi:hypothetical protein